MRDYDVDDWVLEIGFHWPHQRLALGWDIMNPDDKHNYTTIRLYLFVMTITLDF
jgi:hypothetical protein